MTLKNVPCSKHPNHKDFIPVRLLSENHLPKPYDRREWVNFIRLLAKDTVRLSVGSTSAARSEDVGFTQYVGTNHVRHGSGTAFLMDMGRPQRCMVPGCRENGEAGHTVSGSFKVVTAAHVVFDDSEAVNTQVEFFYDDETSHSKGKVVRAIGVRTSSVDLQKNRCILECVTHDMGLFSRLNDYRTSRTQILRSLQEIGFSQNILDAANDVAGESMSVTSTQSVNCEMTVIISHPHGAAKHVTVGKLISMDRDGQIRQVSGGSGMRLMGCMLRYTTPTCTGSGGGTVSVFGGNQLCMAFAPHCASSSVSRHNVSGLGWTSRID